MYNLENKILVERLCNPSFCLVSSSLHLQQKYLELHILPSNYSYTCLNSYGECLDPI